jgi:alpha-glucoside transport system substrate-binding protein
VAVTSGRAREWHRPGREGRLGLLALLLVLAAAVGGACGPAAPNSSLGGSVSILGSWDGQELEAFRGVLRPFEEETGIRVLYTGSRDLAGTLARTIAAGDAPDIAGLAGPAHMAQLMDDGKLIPLDTVVDLGAYKAETAPAFVDLGTIGDHLAGVFIKATVKGLLWYDKDAYRLGLISRWSDLQATVQNLTGPATHPWCLGLESGAASGWPGTDWIEDFLLRESGVEAYDAWVKGDLAWTSEAVRNAFLDYGIVAADGAVAGGSRGALRTYFGDAGKPLFTNPPGCIFLHQGSFMGSFFREAKIDDSAYDFMPFPEIDPRYRGSIIGAGDLVGLVRDTPSSRALIRYLVSSDAQQRFVDQGGALSGNLKVERFPDAVTERASQVLISAKRFRFDASDSMPEGMSDAFLQAVLDYTRDPTQLDDILDHLDVVQRTAYR